MRKLILSVVSLLSITGCEGTTATVEGGATRGSAAPASTPPSPVPPQPTGTLPANAKPFALPNMVSCTSPAPRAFGGALCVCEDFTLAGAGFNAGSSAGGNAAVGVNGAYRVAGHHRIDGTLAVGGELSAAGMLDVRGDALTQHTLSGAGNVSIAKDLSVGSDLWFSGRLEVGGTLRVRGSEQLLGSVVTRRGPYQAPAGLPCNCDPASLIDVAAEVAAAATNNNNASIGLHGLTSAGVLKLQFAGGRYYVADAAQAGVFELHVTQPSALYVQGGLRSAGVMKVTLDPGATLDVYIAGTFAQAGWTVTGGDPGSLRFYIGGRDSMVMAAGYQVFIGSIYAPQAEVMLAGDTVVHGSLFAKRLSGAGLLNIDFAAPTLPGSCGADGGVAPAADAGGVVPPDAGASDDGGIT